MWEYKKQLHFYPESFVRRLRRQKKNLFRRKRISIFRLKTKGFGFLTSAFLKKKAIFFFKKRQPLFYAYSINFIQPDAFFKNTTKVQTFVPVLNFFLGKFNLYFNNFYIESTYPIMIVFFNKIIKSFFFFKFFFFKFFFFKFFFFKVKKLLFLNKFT